MLPISRATLSVAAGMGEGLLGTEQDNPVVPTTIRGVTRLWLVSLSLDTGVAHGVPAPLVCSPQCAAPKAPLPEWSLMG